MPDDVRTLQGDFAKLATGLPPAATASPQNKGLYVAARFAAQNDHYYGFYRSWSKAANFLIGEHWRKDWNSSTLTWQAERDIPAWHQQPVTNMTYAVFRGCIAKLTKQKPTLEVVPPSGDSDDKEAAELSEALLTYLWRQLKKPQKVPVLIAWLLVTAKAYVRVGWDPTAGPLRPRTIPMQRKRQLLGAPDDTPSEIADAGDLDAEDVDVAADEHGEPYTIEESGAVDFDRAPDMEPIGEISWEVVTPLAVRLNPEATSHEDAYEMFVAFLWPRNRAAEQFGVKEELLGQWGDSDEQRRLFEDLISATTAGAPRSWADQTSVWGVSLQEAIGDRVLVVEYYHKQDAAKGFPEGRHWIAAGGVKVWPPESKQQANDAKQTTQPGEDGQDVETYPNGEAPLPFGFWPPLVPCVDTPIPGQPNGLSVIQQIVPLNEQLNVLDGKIAEHHVMNAMGGIWFVSPEDEHIVITSEPGQVVVSQAMGRRGAAFAPFQAQMHPLAEAVYREREVLMNKMQVVSALSSLDLQQKAEGTPSGRALLVGQETSDSTLMPTLIAIEACLEECGRRELVVAQKKYTEPRTVAIKGEQGEWLFRSFTNADLGDGHDVRVQVGSSFPWSKSAQWDTKIQVIEALPQLVMKEDGVSVDRQKVAKYLDSGTPGLSAFDSFEDPDLVEIQREHAMFEAYNPDASQLALPAPDLPKTAFWQNHAIHFQEHCNFMKRDYGRFKRWHPVAQQAFLQHIQLTLIAVQELTKQLMGPSAPGGEEDTGSAPEGGTSGAAPHGPEGKGGLSLVSPGPAKRSPTQLKKSDFAAAHAGG